MEDVMRALQSQAMRLNVHIMLLSQLKREQKDPSRKIKKLRPALDSGKGSSEIEQLSRYILGVYQEPEDMMLNERRAEISVLKAPGPLFDLACTFDNTRRIFTKFDFAGTVPDGRVEPEGEDNERWYDR
jgi:replicative DNA helicase